MVLQKDADVNILEENSNKKGLETKLTGYIQGKSDNGRKRDTYMTNLCLDGGTVV